MTDLIEHLLGIEPGTPLHALRAGRAAIRDHAEAAHQALLHPAEPGAVPVPQRHALAALAARLDGDHPLAEHYAAAAAAPASPAAADLPERLSRYAHLVAQRPAAIDQATIDRLRDSGLSPQDVVAVTQLVAFIPYQVRLRAGLRALAGAPGAPQPAPTPARGKRFTAAEVGWTPRIPPVDPATATPQQLAALDACPPAQRRSTYFLTLAQDPASLHERGALFNAVMYAPRGLPRAERELATAVVSMVNGCVYCCSVHARRFNELTHGTGTMDAILAAGFATPLPPRQRAIVDLSAKLTATPGALGAPDLQPLRTAGLADGEILDLVHAVAMFANANRLMQALGDTDPTP